MPVIFDTLLILLLLDLMVHHIGTMEELFLGTHLCPLERSERLWHKERCTYHDLAFSISVLLGHLIIPLRDLLSQPCNPFHIFFRFCRLSQHKIKFYTVPAALKGLSGSIQNHFFCQTLVDHITKSLTSSLRCKGQTTLTNVLHFTHNIQRKCIDS